MDASKTSASSLRSLDPTAPLPISVRGVVEYLLGYRYWILIPTVIAMLIAAVIMLLTPNLYKSSATILPSGQTEGVSSLKDLVGLGSMGMVDENSSQLYPLILRSQQLKTALLNRSFTFENGGSKTTLTLAQYFKESDPTRLSRAIDDITSVSTGKRTGELVLQVTSRYPAMSQQLATAYLEELETFNRFKRATTAGSNQVYLEKQLTKTTEILNNAEEKLEAFRRVNSDWAMTSDAETLTELGRLQREVELQSTALMYLRQQYEAARLTAQKDVPILRILDYPNLPTLKIGPERTKVCLLTALLTALSIITGLLAFAVVRDLFYLDSTEEAGASVTDDRRARLTLFRTGSSESTIGVGSTVTGTKRENRLQQVSSKESA